MSTDTDTLDMGFEIPEDALDRLDPEMLRKWPQGLTDMLAVIEEALTHRGATPEQASQIAFVVVRALAQFAGGRSIYLPKGEALDRALRDRALWERFDGHNVSELAARAQLTEVQVYAILAEQRKLARRRMQPGLF